MNLRILAYPVCHQLPERSFVFGNLVMPLCARCSGIYLGFLAASISLIIMAGGNKRGTKLPQTIYLLILLSFVFLLGVDVLADKLGWYQSNNHLRLITGLLMGISLANIILPVFNFTFWQENDKIALLNGYSFLGIILVNSMIYLSIIYAGKWLFWLLAIGSIAGVIAIYLCINSLVYMILGKKENCGKKYSDLINIGLAAAIMSIVELFSIAIIKSRFLF